MENQIHTYIQLYISKSKLLLLLLLIIIHTLKRIIVAIFTQSNFFFSNENGKFNVLTRFYIHFKVKLAF